MSIQSTEIDMDIETTISIEIMVIIAEQEQTVSIETEMISMDNTMTDMDKASLDTQIHMSLIDTEGIEEHTLPILTITIT